MAARLTLGRGGLATAGDIRGTLESAGQGAPQELTSAPPDLGHHSEVINRLGRALAAELPPYAQNGSFIAAKYLPQLDEFWALRECRPAADRRPAKPLCRRNVLRCGIIFWHVFYNNHIIWRIDRRCGIRLALG